MTDTERFSETVAIVTGGAGPNIGSAIARRFADQGAQTVILDKDETAGTQTQNEIVEEGGTATFLETDVTNVSEIEDAIDEIVAKYGTIDVLVNSAGGPDGVEMETVDEGAFYVNVDRNLKSAFFTTKCVLPHLKDGGGSVTFVSSVNALVGGFSEIGYSTAKAGLHSLARVLTADYSRFGIRFNVVCPGTVVGDSTVWESRAEENPDIMKELAELYPMGRYGTPDDVAGVVAFLASEEAQWITGVTLPVDGGLTAVGNLPGGRWWENLG